MARAITLAERGRGTTHPNPLVGAVLVTADGIVVGQGAHLRAGGPHAEIHALRMAGEAARGATLYSTLEPCCHVGRTGPCVEAIHAAGVSRVVSALEDPNPKVAGAGHAWLRSRGIAVDVGIGGAEARRQNAPFLTWMTERRPWTVLKAAVSVDGFVGPEVESASQRRRMTGPAMDRWMHRQRAWIDAIAVGAGTALADDPLLTARGAYRDRPLTRVILDWRARVPATARVYSTRAAGPVIMVTLQSSSTDACERLEQLGATIERFESPNLVEVGRRLGDHGIQSLLVEGGPVLQQAWSQTAPVDAVQWIQTAVTLGRGVPVAPALAQWATRASRAADALVFGADRLVEGTWN